MKRLLFLLGTVLIVVPVFSQNTLIIHQKDGTQFCYGFDDKPLITYSDSVLVLKTANTEVQYPLSKLSKFTLDDIDDAVISIKGGKSKAQLDLDNYQVSIKGAKSGTEVFVISSDGKNLATYKADEEGNVSFSIAELPEGTYIIKSESLTCKILKK